MPILLPTLACIVDRTCLRLQALFRQIDLLALLGSSGAVAHLVADAMGKSEQVACLSWEDRERVLRAAAQDWESTDGRLCDYLRLLGVPSMPDDAERETRVHAAPSHSTYMKSDH